MTSVSKKRALFTAVLVFLCTPSVSWSSDRELGCLNDLSPSDALLVADSDGRVLLRKNESEKCVPASTLKVLTALAAIHHLGLSYRFRTEFYIDSHNNLKMKGYGDPLLTSEIWREIAEALAGRIHRVNDLVLDDTYYDAITIPGRENSLNPYDAPIGALCANFNTVAVKRGRKGRIKSAEPQTPLLPFVRQRVRSLGLHRGRYTICRDHGEASAYAGGLLLYFLKEEGVRSSGRSRRGAVRPEDELAYVYRSRFDLGEVLSKMLESSNNLIANQVLVTLGAEIYGAPGTLAKGVAALDEFAKKELGLKGVEIAEGSGLSRKNRISAEDMLTVLKHFEPYRRLLKTDGRLYYKTGTLSGIKNRVGYVEENPGEIYYFIIFLNGSAPDCLALMNCLLHRELRRLPALGAKETARNYSGADAPVSLQ